MITVWEKPNCPQCDFVKKKLSVEGVGFEVKQIFDTDMNIHPHAKKLMEDHGVRSAPIVESSHIIFGGNDKAKLQEAIEWERVWD